jgi:hypothetical protein
MGGGTYGGGSGTPGMGVGAYGAGTTGMGGGAFGGGTDSYGGASYGGAQGGYNQGQYNQRQYDEDSYDRDYERPSRMRDPYEDDYGDRSWSKKNKKGKKEKKEKKPLFGKSKDKNGFGENADFGSDDSSLSVLAYMGYELLFSIPIVGFAIMIVFSLGGTKNPNVRNFARSFLCYFVIVLIIVVIASQFLAGGGGGLYTQNY